MPDPTKRPLSEWRETEWLHHLQQQAHQLTACPHHANDLAHTCLLAFHNHHCCYPWQHSDPAYALRWCAQKLRALACDAHRHAQRHPCLALEMLPENFACVEIAVQVQETVDSERFLASLPPRLRAMLELRLAGYSWDEAAQQLGVKASTLRGYLPELRAKFVEFFGYDPSNRASESFDGLGRLKTVGDYRGAVVYHYETGTGRLQREDYPNGSYVAYTYYGADNPSQVGFVWRVEHKRATNDSLPIGYEYVYDLLGRVETSVEYPNGDKTVYAYTPAGRLESEVREGQVWYSRSYEYHLDGSRHTVERNDMLHGAHRDVYAYDPVSGRLASVQDEWTGEVNSFVWNPEGTLARWEQPNSYARVFGYDEEGRLVKIERDYGAGGVQVAYEYGYNSDGARVWKRDRRDMQNEQEYRYVCRIGCGGVPMRVYNRPMNGGSWASVEDYLRTPTVIAYTHVEGTFGHYVWLSGHWLADWTAGGGWMYYQDQFGVEVDTVYIPAALPKPGPEYLRQDDGVLLSDQCGGYLPTYALFLQTTQQNPNPPKPAPKPPKPAPKKDPFQECLDACTEMGEDLMKKCNQEYVDCLNSPLPLPCFTLYMLCISKAGNALFGCIASCHAQFKKPFPTLPTQKEDEWNKSVDTGIKQYDSCDDDMRKKHPKLPKPEKPKLK